MELTESYVFIPFTVLNLILHGLCSTALCATRKRNERSSQHLYLLNLVIVELVKNLLVLLCLVLNIIWHLTENKTSMDVLMILNYIYFGPVYYLYIGSMFTITADRLVAIRLSIQYMRVWNIRRSKFVIVSIWCFSVLLFMPLILGLHFTFDFTWFTKYHIWDTIRIYQRIAFSILFMVFAILTYTIIFFKYKKSQKRVSCVSVGITNMPKQSNWQLFRCSRFYMSFLLVISFIVLAVIPDLLWISTTFIHIHSLPSSVIQIYSFLSQLLSDSVDALVYVWMYRPVTSYLKTKVRLLMEQMKNKTDKDIKDMTPGAHIGPCDVEMTKMTSFA